MMHAWDIFTKYYEMKVNTCACAYLILVKSPMTEIFGMNAEKLMENVCILAW